jgi:hypothetical protein
MLEEVAHF